MPEAVTIAGDIQAASLAASIDVLGETFTITNQLSTGYDPATSESLPDMLSQSVKGIYDYRYSSPSGEGADVRVRERAIVIPVVKADGNALSFIPGVGDTLTGNSLVDSIRAVDVLQGSQGVTVFYRLTLAGS